MENLTFEFNQNISEQELEAYNKLSVLYKNGELYSSGGHGNFSIYLGDSYLSFELDLNTNRICSFLGQYFVDKLRQQRLMQPKDIKSGILQLKGRQFSQEGSGIRMSFNTKVCYDKKEKLLLIGDLKNDLPLLQFFENGFVQLGSDGQIKSIMFSNIDINLEKDEEYSK